MPTRTDSNRRLYSERDIAAIAWVRDQTDRGQGTSEAIAMLQSRHAEPRVADPRPAPSPIPHNDASPVDDLVDALLDGELDRAQQAWDRLALAVSVDALCTEVLLPAHRALLDADEATSRATMLHATAFLRRKASAMLDHAGPDAGNPSICLVSTGDDIPALALATVLARAGLRVITPILDTTAIDAITLVREAQPAMTIIVADGQHAPRDIAAFAALLPGSPVAVWAPHGLDAIEFPDGLTRLPSSPANVARRLRRER